MKAAWNSYNYHYRRDGAVALVYLLSRIAIRHTQQQKLGGATVCQLPPKTEAPIAGAALLFLDPLNVTKVLQEKSVCSAGGQVQ